MAVIEQLWMIVGRLLPMDLPMRRLRNPRCESRTMRQPGSLRRSGSHYGSEGWGFESLRARLAKFLVAALPGHRHGTDVRRHPYACPYINRDAS